jgi:hypothetical protein
MRGIIRHSSSTIRICTGSLFDPDGTHSNNLVVLDGDKRFFLLSMAAGTIVTEEGTRLDVEDYRG